MLALCPFVVCPLKHAILWQGAGMSLQQFLATDSVFFVGVVLPGGFNPPPGPRTPTTSLAVLECGPQTRAPHQRLFAH